MAGPAQPRIPGTQAPPTPAAYPADPARFTLQSTLFGSANRKVLRVAAHHDQMQDRRIQRAIRENARTVVPGARADARDWDWQGSVGIVNRPMSQTERQEYQQAFNLRPVRSFNVFTTDLEPRRLEAFAMRHAANHPQAGQLVTDQHGNTFISFAYFAQVLARAAFAALSIYNFIGGFWQLQIIDENGVERGQRQLHFDTPTLDAVAQAILDMNDGETSGDGQDLFQTQGYKIRILAYQPSTGQAVGPARRYIGLESRCRTVFIPTPGRCGPKALTFVLEEDLDKRKKYKQFPTRLDKSPMVAALIEAVGGDTAWGYSHLEPAAQFADCTITVLHTATFARLYQAGDGEREVFLLYDPDVPEAERHWMGCIRPNSLLRHKQYCHDCRQLATPNHQCSKFQCKFCRANHATHDEFRQHFWVPEHERCENCNKSMPHACRVVHEPRCKGIDVECLRCKSRYTRLTSANQSNPRAISDDDHIANHCGKGHTWCGSCERYHHPTEDGHRIYPKDFRFKFGSSQTRDAVVFDLEAMSVGPHGMQEVTYACFKRVPMFEEGMTREQYLELLAQVEESEPFVTFEGKDALHQACCYIVRDLHHAFILAFNLRSYDGILIVNHLERVMNVRVDKVLSGQKIMFAKVGSNRLIDMLNHVQGSLADLPKTVGVDDVPGLTKSGDYPVRFTRPEHLNYVGRVPDLRYYMTEAMEEHGPPESLVAWYRNYQRMFVPWTTELWNRREQEAKYCKQDVRVLYYCAAMHRYNSIIHFGIDPFISPTQSSHGFKTWRTYSCPPEGLPTLSPELNDEAHDAFFGGLVIDKRSWVQCGLDEEVAGYDGLSHYPSVNFHTKVPWGVPDKVDGADLPPLEEWVEQWHYLARVDVTPRPYDPEDPGYIPPLLERSKYGRLEANHMPKKYALYCSVDLAAGYRNGDKIDKVHYAYVWKEARDDLFKDYMRMGMKAKIESGPPPATEAEADAIIEAWGREPLKIEIDRDELMKPANKGRRDCAKRHVNSGWGRFSMSRFPVRRMVGPPEYHRVMARMHAGEIKLVGVHFEPYMEDTITVEYFDLTQPQHQIENQTYVIIGVWTTAKGREWLRDLASHPQIRSAIVYGDTDSFFVKKRRSDPELPSTPFWRPLPGECWCEDGVLRYRPDPSRPPLSAADKVPVLGSWEPEYVGDDKIAQFCSIGPKLVVAENWEGKVVKMATKGLPIKPFNKHLITVANFRACQLDHDRVIETKFPLFRIQPAGKVYVQTASKQVRWQPHTKKDKVAALDGSGMAIAWHPGLERYPAPDRPKPQRKHAPLPAPEWGPKRPLTKKRRVADDDSDGTDDEDCDEDDVDADALTDAQSDAAHAAAVAQQDARAAAAADTPLGLLMRAVDDDLAQMS